VGIRRGENKRESWWVTNNTNDTITIGDLLLVPAIKPGKRIDLLHYYSREKISHSKVLVTLVKANIVSLDKDKIYSNSFPSAITEADIDEAITPAEENEISEGGTSTHNDLTGIQGGVASEYYHIDATDITNLTTLTDGSNADLLHVHAGGGTHNSLTGLQGGDTNEYYHFTEDQFDLLMRINEDSAGLTFDGYLVGADSLWKRAGTTLSQLYANDDIDLGSGDLTTAGTLDSGAITMTGAASTIKLVNDTATWDINSASGSQFLNFVRDASTIMQLTSSGGLNFFSTAATGTIRLAADHNATIQCDRGILTRIGEVQFLTNGSLNWALGTPDSDIFGDGTDFFIGQTTAGASPAMVIDTSNNTTLNGSLTTTGNMTISSLSEGYVYSSSAGLLSIADNSEILNRLDEDSAGLTFDGISLLDSLWSRTGTTLSPINTGDDLDLGSGDLTTTGRVGIGVSPPISKFHMRAGQLGLDQVSGGPIDLSKFNSQGVAWSHATMTTSPSILLNGGPQTYDRAEISWYRNTRAYPEASLRQRTTADTGLELWVSNGQVASVLAQQWDYNGGNPKSTVGKPTGSSSFQIVGAAGQNRELNFLSDVAAYAGNRWIVKANNTAESGANAGSNFQIDSRADNGDAISTVLTIERSSGNFDFQSGDLTTTGDITNYTGISTGTAAPAVESNKIIIKGANPELYLYGSGGSSSTIRYQSAKGIILQDENGVYGWKVESSATAHSLFATQDVADSMIQFRPTNRSRFLLDRNWAWFGGGTNGATGIDSYKVYFGAEKDAYIEFDGEDLIISVGENPSAEGKIKLNDDVEVLRTLSVGSSSIIIDGDNYSIDYPANENLSIAPNSTQNQSPAVTFFENVSQATDKPAIRLYGITNTGKKYVDMYIDTYRRFIFGGTVENVNFNVNLGLGTTNQIEWNDRYNIGVSTAGSIDHPIMWGRYYNSGAGDIRMPTLIFVPETGSTPSDVDYELNEVSYARFYTFAEESNLTDYLGIWHNGENGEIKTGAGSLILNPANGNVILGDSSIYFDGTDLIISIGENPSAEGVIKLNDDVEVLRSLTTTGDITTTGTITATSMGHNLAGFGFSPEGTAGRFTYLDGSMIIRSNGNIDLRASDGGDYIRIVTVANEPYIETVGNNDLNLNPSSGLVNLGANNLSTTGNISTGDGTAAAPTYSFASESDTGMYRQYADQISFATAGITRFTIASTYITSQTGNFNLKLTGSNALPPQMKFWKDRYGAVLQSGDSFGSFLGNGTRGSYNTCDSAEIAMVADELWTTSSCPSRIDFYTTPSGSLTKAVVFSLSPSGDATVSGDITTTGNLYFGENQDSSIYFDGEDLIISVGEDPSQEGVIKLNDDVEILRSLSVDTEEGTMILSTGSITDTSGTISFDDENLTTTGNIYLTDNSTSTLNNESILIEQLSTGDPSMQFTINGGAFWRVGIDNSQSDRFCISCSTNASGNFSNPFLSMDTSANLYINAGGRGGGGSLFQFMKGSADIIYDVFTATLERGGGEGGIGMGLGYAFDLENSTGAIHDAGRFEFIWENPTNTSEDVEFNIQVMSNGSFTTPFIISGANSNIKINTDLLLNSNSSKLYLGENQDSSIYFDGTDLIIENSGNPSDWGTLKVFGNVNYQREFANPDSVAISAGSTSSGIDDLEIWGDGKIYIFVEGGSPGQVFEFTFNNIENFSHLLVRAFYDGTTNHEMKIQLYNYQLSDYDTVRRLSKSSLSDDFEVAYLAIPDSSIYIKDETVLIKFVHSVNGTNGHETHIDFLGLEI
jgi:hypothetical protein